MPDTPLPVRFGDDGLVPAVIVDAAEGDVLMVGFMNEEALAATRATGLVHFWSRSRSALWKKGGTSGHIQQVREIRINCDLNSLLIEVDQEGAVCHDGYATCYYRRLDADNTLRIVRDRVFDPLDVYPESGEPAGLATQTRKWWTAYEWLRDHDLTAESGTSRRLRGDRDESTPRVADELRELAGVLDGTHRHGAMEDDLRLEAGQVLYWLACAGAWHGYRWEQVRPDRALDVSGDISPGTGMLARLLGARADEIDDALTWPKTAMLHDTIALVGTVLRANAIDPLDVINADLAELNAKPYLPDLTALDS
jgi:phosphoribosyl-AMP cyclohydrolase